MAKFIGNVIPFRHGSPEQPEGDRPEASYLLLEDGRKLQLEQSCGCLLLEYQDIRVFNDWNMPRDGKL